MVNLNDIITAWNSQADEHNQWSDLGEDEKVEFAYRMGSECDGPQGQQDIATWAALSGLAETSEKLGGY